VKMLDAGKTRMIGLPYGEKNCDDMLSRFHLIPERNGQTDGQTDGCRRTDRFAISISRVSMLTRDKNDRRCLPLRIFIMGRPIVLWRYTLKIGKGVRRTHIME